MSLSGPGARVASPDTECRRETCRFFQRGASSSRRVSRSLAMTDSVTSTRGSFMPRSKATLVPREWRRTKAREQLAGGGVGVASPVTAPIWRTALLPERSKRQHGARFEADSAALAPVRRASKPRSTLRARGRHDAILRKGSRSWWCQRVHSELPTPTKSCATLSFQALSCYRGCARAIFICAKTQTPGLCESESSILIRRWGSTSVPARRAMSSSSGRRGRGTTHRARSVPDTTVPARHEISTEIWLCLAARMAA